MLKKSPSIYIYVYIYILTKWNEIYTAIYELTSLLLKVKYIRSTSLL